MLFGSAVRRLVALILILAPVGAAQQEPQPNNLPDAPKAKPSSTPQKNGNPLHTTVEILARRSIFFPDLATSPHPLSAKQKFELFADESVSPARFMGSAAGAGIGQARNALPGYGQGMSGYGKRFGTSLATAASSSFFGKFVIPSMLHHDPRYFVTLHGGPMYRVGYAISRIVITRTDDGRNATNWSGIIAPLLAESLANSYLPVKEQTAGNTFQRYGWRIGMTTVSNALREYWPTIFRNLRITKIAPSTDSNPNSSAPATPGAARLSPQ